MKALETEPYTQEEADRAAGMGSYIAPKHYEIKTQPGKNKFNEIYNAESNKDSKLVK